MGPTYAEEVHYMDLGDRVIITFGQVQFPLALQEIAEGTELAIQPVIRIVMPRVAAQKMVELFQKGPFSSKAETEK